MLEQNVTLLLNRIAPLELVFYLSHIIQALTNTAMKQTADLVPNHESRNIYLQMILRKIKK